MAGIMASAVLAGCTNEPAPSSTSQAEAGKDSAAGSGAPAASGDQITLRFMWWGGDERNEATLAVIDQYQKLHPEVRIEAEMNSDQGYIDKVSTMLANGTATFKGQIHTNPKWMDGKFVFAYGPSSSINLLMDAVPEAECTVVQMPMAENRVNDGFFADTPQYMTVNKNSEHVEEAVDFLNYFYNNAEAQETLKDVRSIPPTSTARQLCADKGLLNQTVVDAVDLAAGLNGKSDKGYTTSAEVYAIQEDMIESIAYGQSTPEEAADNAIELINDYLSGLN